MIKILLTVFMIFLSGSVFASGAIDYDKNTSPSPNDELIGIVNPDGSWSMNRITIQGILDLIDSNTSSDEIPPTVQIYIEVDLSEVPADYFEITTDSLDILFQTQDNVGVTGCRWLIGAAPIATTGAVTIGDNSTSTSGYIAGTNTIYIGCYDAAGNWGYDSASVLYSPSSDTTAPVTTITTTDPQDIVSDTLSVAYTATDNEGINFCKWRVNAEPWKADGQGTLITGGSPVTTSGYTDGYSNLLYIKCWDNALNNSLDAITVNYNETADPDVTKPVITMVTPSQTITADSLSVAFLATDNSAITACKWRIGSLPDAGNGTVSTSPAATSGYSVGDNLLFIGCYDDAATPNWGYGAITVTYDTGGDTTPPVITFTSDDPSYITTDSFTAAFTVTDNVAPTTCRWLIGGTAGAGLGTLFNVTSGANIISTTGYLQTTNTLSIACRDAIGNSNEENMEVVYSGTASVINVDIPGSQAAKGGWTKVNDATAYGGSYLFWPGPRMYEGDITSSNTYSFTYTVSTPGWYLISIRGRRNTTGAYICVPHDGNILDKCNDVYIKTQEATPTGTIPQSNYWMKKMTSAYNWLTDFDKWTWSDKVQYAPDKGYNFYSYQEAGTHTIVVGPRAYDCGIDQIQLTPFPNGHISTSDLVGLHHDFATDPDDGISALMEMIMCEEEGITDYYGLAGCYGATQDPPHPEVNAVMTAIFGADPGFYNAGMYGDKSYALNAVANRWVAALNRGDDVWIMDGGTEDNTAAIYTMVKARLPGLNWKTRIHVVQHGYLNWQWTDPTAHNLLVNEVDYKLIDNGNYTPFGTADDNQPGGTARYNSYDAGLRRLNSESDWITDVNGDATYGAAASTVWTWYTTNSYQPRYISGEVDGSDAVTLLVALGVPLTQVYNIPTWMDYYMDGTGVGCVPTESPETSCSDAVDNDCDTYIDALDTDCQDEGTGDFTQGGASNYLVNINAEEYSAKIAYGSSFWTAYGTGSPNMMQALPDSGVNIGTGYAPASSPRLDYDITFNQTGTHYVWIKGTPISNGNTVHVGLNETYTATGLNCKMLLTETWTKFLADGTSRITVNVPSTGVHTLNVWMREDGMTIEEIVLTTQSAYDAESP